MRYVYLRLSAFFTKLQKNIPYGNNFVDYLTTMKLMYCIASRHWGIVRDGIVIEQHQHTPIEFILAD